VSVGESDVDLTGPTQGDRPSITVVEIPVDDLEEEDDPVDDDEDDDPTAPDPFVASVRPTMDIPTSDAIARRRAEARAQALMGEHKIYFSDPAGPGTLAEALNLLLHEGDVTAEFRDESGEDAHLLYRPNVR